MEFLQRGFCLLLVVFSSFVSVSKAYEFYVGGRDGWVLNPSEGYIHWSARNRFQVNDSLIFKFKEGSNSVLLVDKDDYNKCNRDNPIKKMENGESVFKFDRSGSFFFISGNNHGACEKGQKLSVTVLSPRHRIAIPVVSPANSPASHAPVVAIPVMAPVHTPAMTPKSPSPSSAKTPAHSPGSHGPVVKPPVNAPAHTPDMTPKSALTPAHSPASHAPVVAIPVMAPGHSPAMAAKPPSPSAHTPASHGAPARTPAMTPKSPSSSAKTPASSPESHAPAHTPAMAPKSPSPSAKTPASSPAMTPMSPPSAKAPAPSATTPVTSPTKSPSPSAKAPATSSTPVPSPSEGDYYSDDDVNYAPAPSPASSSARRVVVTPSTLYLTAATMVLSVAFGSKL